MPETEQKHKSRKIGDLFSDYKTNSNIEDAEIARMNLHKKDKHIRNRNASKRIYRNKRNMVL